MYLAETDFACVTEEIISSIGKQNNKSYPLDSKIMYDFMNLLNVGSSDDSLTTENAFSSSRNTNVIYLERFVIISEH